MRILISKRNVHQKAKENKLLHFWLAYNKQHRTINIEFAVGWYFASLTCNLRENAFCRWMPKDKKLKGNE